jgi:hypothetical protein
MAGQWGPAGKGAFTTSTGETTMSSSNQAKSNRQTRLRQAMSGIEKYFLSLPSLTLAGVSYSPADLTKLFQSGIDASLTSSNSKAKWLADVQVERNMFAKIDPVFRLFKSWVTTYLGDTQDAAQKLEDFAFTPRKARAKKTAATKAGAAVKAKATRTARHTMGKQQKKAVKGTVAPATTPATPAATTVPAPAKPTT